MEMLTRSGFTIHKMLHVKCCYVTSHDMFHVICHVSFSCHVPYRVFCHASCLVMSYLMSCPMPHVLSIMTHLKSCVMSCIMSCLMSNVMSHSNAMYHIVYPVNCVTSYVMSDVMSYMLSYVMSHISVMSHALDMTCLISCTMSCIMSLLISYLMSCDYHGYLSCHIIDVYHDVCLCWHVLCRYLVASLSFLGGEQLQQGLPGRVKIFVTSPQQT